MSDEVIDLGWIGRTLRSVQAEQAALRGMVEPLPARFSALEARFDAFEGRFRALEARIGGIEQSVNAIGLTLRDLVEAVRGR